MTTRPGAAGAPCPGVPREDADPERGSAVVEYLLVALVLLLPVIYLVVALGRVQAASFAAETAAREAGRMVAQAESAEEGAVRAAAAVQLAFADQGLDVDGTSALTITCEADPCHTPGAYIEVAVGADVPLPFLPASIGGVPTSIAVAAEHLVQVEDQRGVP